MNDIKESWTYKLPREYLLEHAQDWYECNERLKIECPKYGIEYIDPSRDREKVLNEILEKIQEKNNTRIVSCNAKIRNIQKNTKQKERK